MEKPKYYTHYSYLSGPQSTRVPEDFFDLDDANVSERRELIHGLLDIGRLLAELPAGFTINPDRKDLEGYINDDFESDD